MMHHLKKNQSGFTLIELMIVVAIVAILGAIAYPSYLDSVRKGKRAEGRTASDAIRQFIEAELAGGARPRAKTLSGWRALVVAAVAGLALGAVAAPSLAQSNGPGAERFERLDRNHDGVLSRDEYLAR